MASDNHASYTRIGLTVVIGVVAIVASLIYIGGMRGEANVVYAETYYDKPVSGLSVGSVVNFRGVKIGEVKEISFVGDEYDVEGVANSRIYILMALQCGIMDPENETPAEAEAIIRQMVEKVGLRATVTTSGITGLSRIECDYHDRDDSDTMDVPPITWTPKHVYIPAKISLLDNFSVAATKVMNQINRMDLSAAWSNLNSAVESLARATEGAKNMLDARQGDLDLIIDDFSATSASLRDLAIEVKRNPSLLIRESKAQRLEETE